jgi:hypothetical protein
MKKAVRLKAKITTLNSGALVAQPVSDFNATELGFYVTSANLVGNLLLY